VQGGLLGERDAAPALHRDAQALLEPLPRLVGLAEEHARVEREERRGRELLGDEVGDDDRLLLKRAGHGDPLEAVAELAEQLAGLLEQLAGLL